MKQTNNFLRLKQGIFKVKERLKVEKRGGGEVEKWGSGEVVREVIGQWGSRE